MIQQPVIQRRMILCLLVLFAVAVCARMPEIVLKGRFWAEEGKFFFPRAWEMPALPALFYSFGGYLNLVANAATLAAARLMPLAVAPYLTITVALSLQLCAPLLLLTARDPWLARTRVRVAAMLLVLLVPASEEVWLQTLHCQFQLVLCGGLILALRPVSGWGAWFRYGLLLLAPLCGPVAITLLPLFLARAGMDRAWPRLRQAGVLFVGAAIQLMFFFQAVPGRGYSLNVVTLLLVVAVRHLVTPFLGVCAGEAIATLIRTRLAVGATPLGAAIVPVLVFVPFLLTTLRRRSSRPAFWLLAAGGVVAGASYFGAIGGAGELLYARHGERYVFAPQALMGVSVLALAATAPRVIARLSWAIVVWLLVMGAWDFVHPWAFVRDGPSYRREIAAWRADPTHQIRLWPPGSDWTMSLPPVRR